MSYEPYNVLNRDLRGLPGVFSDRPNRSRVPAGHWSRGRLNRQRTVDLSGHRLVTSAVARV